MTNVFAYYRVSTQIQVEQETEKTQKMVVNEFAESTDLTIIKEFQDLGVSGAIRTREQYLEMIEQVDTVEGLLVYDLDRLNRDLQAGLELMFILKEKNKKIFVARTKEILDFTDPATQLVTMVRKWANAVERDKMKSRQKAGIRRKIEETGDWGPRIKYGENLQGKKLNKETFWKKIEQYRIANITKAGIARILKISRATLDRRLSEDVEKWNSIQSEMLITNDKK